MEYIDINAKTTELREYISQFETVSFITQYYYSLNAHTRKGCNTLNVKSPLRQITYLISLFLRTNPTGTKVVFDPVTGNSKKIEKLLEEIEKGYRYNYLESLKLSEINDDLLNNNVLVAGETFNNYFVNGELNFIEQEIDRLNRTFGKFDSLIQEKTGCCLEDYLDFYDLLEFIEQHKLQDFFKEIYNDDNIEILANRQKEQNNKGDFVKLVTSVEDALYKIPIHKDFLREVYEPLATKLPFLLEQFSCNRHNNDETLYYTSQCILLSKPLVWINETHFVIPCQKQLLDAIYNFLYSIVLETPNYSRKITETRDKVLEDKTLDVFEEFFGKNARMFKNYFVGGNEKDLLVLYRNTALIIECKANKYREPLRDPVRAYERIKDDFDKCIQTAYDQAHEVKEHFREPTLSILDHKGNVIETINTRKYPNRYTIIVTGERFGQIQCDLGLLLKIFDDDEYPWSVYIDDLETLLITLKRKENAFGEFFTFLNYREKLHERLYCFDEIELLSYYLMDKENFRKNCFDKANYFISHPTMHGLIDMLYQTCLGFKNERHIERKLNTENDEDRALKKQLKIRPSDKEKAFLKQTRKNGID